MMRRKKRLLIILSALLVIVVGLFLGYNTYRYYRGEAVRSAGDLYVPTGSDFDRLIDSLIVNKLLANETQFRNYAKSKELNTKVKPGKYRIEKGMTYSALINMLKSGRQVPVNITFNNIRVIGHLAPRVAERLELNEDSLSTALYSDSVARSYGFKDNTFISMFIPNTYQFYWNSSVNEFLERMKREYDDFWKSRDTQLSRSGLSRTEAITLASIIYEETKKTAEMPRIAGVYINRIKKGIPLQADPTVKFAMQNFALRRVLTKHLSVVSPYNTYTNRGLPPGPICMPSIAAIEAVLNFEQHKYLYFCAKDDMSSSHTFAETLSEHNKNAQAYARALNKLKIYN